MFSKNVIVIRRENGLVLAEYPVSSMKLSLGGCGDGNDLSIVARLKDSITEFPELKAADIPKMKKEEIMKWLEENCRNTSIMWRMGFSGVVKSRNDQCVICYNIRSEKIDEG